jgi:ABC-type nitrate/sulfonate/bicarbonate transport system substrate-binding protein
MAHDKIRVLCSDMSHLPLHFTMRDSGVPQKHGFDLEVDYVGTTGERPLRALSERASCLLAGDYEFLSGLHHEPYAYRARGDKRFVYLAQTQNDWDDRLIARQGITSAKELEGKTLLTIGAPCVGGNLIAGLKQMGVDTAQINVIMATGSQGEMNHVNFEKVRRGEVDATTVDVPFDLRARKLGLSVIELPSIPVIHNTTVCASMDFVSKNEEVVTAYLKALIEAIHFFKTHAQRVCEILSRALAPLIHLEGDAEVEHLQREWSRLLSSKPYPHPLAVWNVYNLDVGHNPALNSISAFEIWDTHYVRMIDDSGFIDSLYSS